MTYTVTIEKGLVIVKNQVTRCYNIVIALQVRNCSFFRDGGSQPLAVKW